MHAHGSEVLPIACDQKNRYAMRTCVCYLEIEQSHGKQANARIANEGHLRFVSAAFGFHCGRWETRYVSELFFIFLSLS